MNKQILLSLIFLMGFTHQIQASHLAAAEFEYTHISGNDYAVSLYLYRDCAGIMLPSSAIVTLASSSCSQNSSITLPLVANNPVTSIPWTQTTCQGGSLPGYEEAIYTDTITLPMACTDWHISYQNCCRNASITNLQSPAAQSFYVSTTIDNSAGINNNSPRYFIDPLFYGSMGSNFSAALGGVDPDGDSLVFSVAAPLDNATTPISFNTGLSVSQPLMIASGTTVSFSNSTGQFNCVLSGSMQVVVFDILVEEYRNGSKIAEHRRTLQLLPVNLSGNSAMTNPNGSVTSGGTMINSSTFGYQSGQPMNFSLLFNDPDASDTITYNATLSSIMNAFPTAQVNTSNPNGNSNELLVDVTIPSPSSTSFMVLLEESGFLQHSFTFELQEASITPTTKLSTNQVVRLFPNPMHASITFDLGKTYEQAHINLFNAKGQLIRSTQVNNQRQVQLQRQDLPAGLYFYQVHADGQQLDQGKLSVQ